MGFCSCTIKFFLFVINFVISICSIALMVIGGIALSKGQWTDGSTKFNENVDYLFRPAAITIIVVGVIIFLIAFMGCCGAVQESPCMITTYAIILLVLVVVEVIIGIVALVFRNKIDEAINNSTNMDYKTLDELQKTLQCCGWKSPDQYPTPAKPPSCCLKSENCTSTSPDFHGVGCLPTIKNFIRDHLTAIGGVAIGFAVVEVLAVIAGCFLANNFRKAEKGF